MKQSSNKFLGLVLLTFFCSLLIKAEEVPEMVTDRPDQSESANIVVPGWLQLETGLTYGMDKMNDMETTNLSLATTLLRFGVLQDMEIRFGFAHTTLTEKFNDMETDLSGLGSTEFGFKIKVTEGDDIIPEIAFLVMTALPYGEDGLVPEFVEPGMRFNIEKDLGNNFGTCINIGMEWVEGIPSYIYTCAVGTSLTGNLCAFVELYGDVSTVGKPNHMFDCGFTYLLMENLQLDLSGGVAITEQTEDMFLGAGVSFRIPR